jgi:hypothetical protein
MYLYQAHQWSPKWELAPDEKTFDLERPSKAPCIVIPDLYNPSNDKLVTQQGRGRRNRSSLYLLSLESASRQLDISVTVWVDRQPGALLSLEFAGMYWWRVTRYTSQSPFRTILMNLILERFERERR